jgi:hypothetical protein
MFEDDKISTQIASQKTIIYLTQKLVDDVMNIQNIHTPFELCYEIIHKLQGMCGGLVEKEILVLNIEFIETLIYEFGISPEKITFITDNRIKEKFVNESERYKGVRVMRRDKSLLEMDLFEEGKKEPRRWDVIVMNPPYQGDIIKNKKNGGKGSRNNTVWQHFVKKAIELCKKDGYIAAIHPPRWRKPDNSTGKLLKSKNIKYLEIHNKNDGMSTFKCMTRYDWYILKNSKCDGKTVIKDENGKVMEHDLNELPFIPHFDFDVLKKILAKDGEEKCEVIFDSNYHTQNEFKMSPVQNDEFKYPCIHSTTKDKIRYFYSITNKMGHFRVSKIIFGENGGDTGIYNSILDFDGKYGITQGAIGIKINSREEGENIIAALQSEKFTTLIHSCQYGGFRIDWRMFKYFRKDFWKEFI